jgi:hypothetical protein
MTQIAQDYHISRTWLYQLIGAAHLQLETLFSAQKPCVEPPLPLFRAIQFSDRSCKSGPK